MKKTITIITLVIAAFICSGFILTPHPKVYQVDVTSRIETIGGHQYAIAVSTTVNGEGSHSSIAMVHHAGCPLCIGRDSRYPLNRPIKPRPPIALPYPGQF